MRAYKIKIKTAGGTRYTTGVFANTWAAIDAGLDILGEAQGNVTAQVQP